MFSRQGRRAVGRRGRVARRAGLHRQAVRPALADRVDEAAAPGLTGRRRPRRSSAGSSSTGSACSISLFEALSYVGSFGIVWLVIAVGDLGVLLEPPVALDARRRRDPDRRERLRRAEGVDRPRPPAARRPGSGAARRRCRSTHSFPSGHATVSFACATVLALAVPRLRDPAVRARRADRLLARLRRRALPASTCSARRRARRRESLQLFGCFKQPCDDQRQRRDEADPEPDPAAGEEELVRDRDRAHEHEDRRRARRARSRRGSRAPRPAGSNPELAVAPRARIAASPMKRTSFPSRPVCQPSTLTSTPSPGAGVPAGEGGQREHEAGDPRHPLAEAPERSCREAVTGRRASSSGTYADSIRGSGVSTERSMGTFDGRKSRRYRRAGDSVSASIRDYTSSMAEPATRPPAGDDAPPFDPLAVDRAYLQERARRRARIERSRARRRASLRFWLVLLGLLAVSVLLTLTIWREIERLFGLLDALRSGPAPTCRRRSPRSARAAGALASGAALRADARRGRSRRPRTAPERRSRPSGSPSRDGTLVARAVWAASGSLAAELEGRRTESARGGRAARERALRGRGGDAQPVPLDGRTATSGMLELAAPRRAVRRRGDAGRGARRRSRRRSPCGSARTGLVGPSRAPAPSTSPATRSPPSPTTRARRRASPGSPSIAAGRRGERSSGACAADELEPEGAHGPIEPDARLEEPSRGSTVDEEQGTIAVARRPARRARS